MAKRDKIRNFLGFTLVEVLITMFLVVSVIAAAGLALENGAWIADGNRARLYAINALREEMETLRNADYDAVVAAGTTSFTNAQLAKLENGVGARTLAASFGADIRKVTLTVSWTLRNGTMRNESLTTYLTRRGLNGN